MKARFVLAAPLVCGCAVAASQAPPASSRAVMAPTATQSSFSPGGRETSGSLSGATMEPRPLPGTVLPSSNGVFRTDTPSLDLPVDHGGREAQVARLEGAIERERATLATSLTECRSVCMAAQNICIAAQEICRLVGDAGTTNPVDVRCRRARTACVDAGRRRDGACPVCP